MYSKTAEEEDNKMADRWQKDADGILIFTGLFSAAVAALLSVSLQSLIPNSQDTSSFYLGNIYGILADPNVTRTSVRSPIAKPPPFSTPRYAIWVNSLWFLSLLISLTGALLATSSHQWARRYIRVTQPPRCSPEKRARMRAFFANGMEKMHIAQVVEGLPTLIHISLFLFFGGVAIFLFNINHAVFNSVVWWIALFAIAYGLITVMPIVRYDSPYYSPLSLPAWFLYTSISYLFFRVIFSIKSDRIKVFRTWQRLRTIRDRYRGWIFGGVEEAAKETASKVSERLTEIDLLILGWTIDALGDDNGLEKFFEAIPGFFNSKLLKHLKKESPNNENRSENLLKKFWKASNGFFERTLLSNSVTEEVKSRRLDIGMNATSEMSNLRISSIPRDLLFQSWDPVPQNVQIGNILTPWCNSNNTDIAWYAHCIATRILASVQERDDSWIGLAADVLGLSKHNLRDIAKGKDISVIGACCRHFQNLTYTRHLLVCSMTSVRCGTKAFEKHGRKGMTVIPSVFSVRLAFFSTLYIKALTLPPLLQSMISTTFCFDQSRIHHSTSLIIARILLRPPHQLHPFYKFPPCHLP
ncbi:hypothetical protein DFH94DRAFT_109574 [Russula ochroleuca]|uniref:DUF6535 domain-containing protein n=1 Tax=Russula ochroleuca TaxID=152965 RepID=A0A9P5T544_9AGAM|nr:hypothetical protein DFH94DRAFT_109574 [Russula ochroleuca]